MVLPIQRENNSLFPHFFAGKMCSGCPHCAGGSGFGLLHGVSVLVGLGYSVVLCHSWCGGHHGVL